MSSPVLVAREDETLDSIAGMMLERRIGGVPVVDAQGQLAGIVTESSFAAKNRGVPFSTLRLPELFGEWLGPEGVERVYEKARSLKASDVMQREVVFVQDDTPVSTILEHMLVHQIHRIPVVRDGIPVGMVARHDLLKLLARRPAEDPRPKIE